MGDLAAGVVPASSFLACFSVQKKQFLKLASARVQIFLLRFKMRAWIWSRRGCAVGGEALQARPWYGAREAAGGWRPWASGGEASAERRSDTSWARAAAQRRRHGRRSSFDAGRTRRRGQLDAGMDPTTAW
ncbi:hypothetical protein GQ55_9G210400 [Panicum hallii var. hallii]|uniref:Uncharacterized protein n=1 Tax=Panicum hallii var. hallii TaxID=1504633 RepID=A0A2T7C5L1_9POAL|nr:hypothetical protein GQ55_9G210400 [Panicum hallii var. hallii]